MQVLFFAAVSAVFVIAQARAICVEGARSDYPERTSQRRACRVVRKSIAIRNDEDRHLSASG